MIVVALDSTTPVGSVGVACWDERLSWIDVRSSSPDASWSERLPEAILDALRDRSLKPTDVDLFGVAAGPGSLTGLRVGIATMQGLAFAAGRPVAAVSALDALAEHVSALVAGPEDVVVGSWTNAMRGEVFSRLYRVRAASEADRASGDPWEPLDEPAVGSPDETARRWQAVLGSRRPVVIGDLEPPLDAALRLIFGDDVRLVPRPLLAHAVATLAVRLARRGAAGPPHAVHPLYVRRPDAVIARERAQSAALRSTADPARP